jgi:hypothetical protein
MKKTPWFQKAGRNAFGITEAFTSKEVLSLIKS